jgi:hypothetical protein
MPSVSDKSSRGRPPSSAWVHGGSREGGNICVAVAPDHVRNVSPQPLGTPVVAYRSTYEGRSRCGNCMVSIIYIVDIHPPLLALLWLLGFLRPMCVQLLHPETLPCLLQWQSTWPYSLPSLPLHPTPSPQPCDTMCGCEPQTCMVDTIKVVMQAHT